MSRRPPRVRAQRGFLIMAGVFLLVVVGAFIGYMATQSTVQGATTVDDVQSARALQAARAGIQWGAWQVLRNSGNCPASTTLTFAGTTLAAFSATVTCGTTTLTEGTGNVVVYTLTSNACNSSPCPNAGTTSSTYVDREVTATLTQ
ncbi:MAG TPA: agglutinin biogenesis protein MshP [Burkholderiales bacterium]|nr:agglutinin biogenesis protein MshP [Burkholderiales bacterium]